MSYLGQPSKIDNLLILRGLCSLGVLIFHTITQPWLFKNSLDMKVHLQTTDLGAVISSALWPQTGSNFVLIFFVLSGYLMGKIYLLGRYELSRKGTYHFYINRYLRIAPLLYFNLAILIILSGDFSLLVNNWKSFLGDIFFANNLTGRVINGVTWSISYEMQYYLLCPLLFWLFSRYCKHNFMPLLTLILVMGAYSYLVKYYSENVFLQMFQFTWLFLSGFFANYLMRFLHEGHGLKGNIFLRFLGFSCFVIAILAYWALWNIDHRFLAQIALCSFAVISIVLLELPMHINHSRITKIIGVPLTWLGQISYGVYLWHYPILGSITGNADTFVRYVVLLHHKVSDFLPLWFLANLTLLGLLITYTLTLSTITFFLVENKFRPGLYKK